MKRILSTLLLFVTSVSCISEKHDLIIYDVYVVDPIGVNSENGLSDIIINDGKIIKIVESGAAKYSAVNVISGDSAFVSPGLWDMHVHLMEESNNKEALPAFIQHGIIYVRDSGGDADSLKLWDAQIESGALVGPEIFYAGPTLNGDNESNAAYTLVINDTLKARKVVDSLNTVGVDFIKVYDQIEREVLKSIITTADTYNLPVAGHNPIGVGFVEASRMGMDSFEHISAMVAAAFYHPDNDRQSMTGAYQFLVGDSGSEIYQRMAEEGTKVTPTLITFRSLVEMQESEEQRQLGLRALSFQQRILKQMHEEGIKILGGSDFGAGDIPMAPGVSLIEEMLQMQEAGLPAAEILKTVTVNPAEFFDQQHSKGRILKGYDADLVLLNKNPRNFPEAYKNTLMVIQKGRKVYDSDL